LGQHTREVLSELDYDEAGIEELLAAGAATEG
jgi:crotonobetainyl-CoA:carnitine CoA-transferase CaiB-like acyl-CoA transferase